MLLHGGSSARISLTAFRNSAVDEDTYNERVACFHSHLACYRSPRTLFCFLCVNVVRKPHDAGRAHRTCSSYLRNLLFAPRRRRKIFFCKLQQYIQPRLINFRSILCTFSLSRMAVAASCTVRSRIRYWPLQQVAQQDQITHYRFTSLHFNFPSGSLEQKKCLFLLHSMLTGG
jgi:hypothetical protein